MADVKVPPMLHKMSVAAQKAWYKKNKMEYPGAGGKEGRSAAQAKKDVGEINKKKAREAAIARAAASKKNKALVSSSERVRAMGKRRRESGEGLGGGLETNRDIISYVRAGGTIKAGRLGEEMTNKDKKKEYVRQVGLKAMKQGKVDPARGHSPQKFGREILKGAAADRAVRKAMEKEMTRMGEEAELTEGRMKDIDTERKETARLAAQEKDLPFTPDKKSVRRGRGGPMSQAKWLAKQAMAKKMKEMGMKEEVEQIDEASHFRYGGEVNGKEYEVTIPRHRDLGDYSDAALHRKLSKENPHLDHHEVTAIVHSGGEEESKVDVEHEGKKYTHHVINYQEPQRIYSEALDPVGKEDKDIDNDGDSDKTDVYLATKRKAIGKAIKDRDRKSVV